LESFRDFTQKLKLFLLDHPYYSLNEFFLYLKKTTEPIISNTSETEQKEDFYFIVKINILLLD